MITLKRAQFKYKKNEMVVVRRNKDQEPEFGRVIETNRHYIRRWPGDFQDIFKVKFINSDWITAHFCENEIIRSATEEEKLLFLLED